MAAKKTRKILFVFVLLFFSSFLTSAQQQSLYNFTIKSKFDTEVELKILVAYQRNEVLKEYDLFIKKIRGIVADSLLQFDIFEMYASKRVQMESIIEQIFKNSFYAAQIPIDKVQLENVKIPAEAKFIYDQLSNLELNYIQALKKIEQRKKDLKLLVQTNIPVHQREEIEKEIFILENHTYISKFFESVFEPKTDLQLNIPVQNP